MNEHQAFQTLNINSNASFDDVKYAYRKLALELHPDKNSNEKDGKKFKDVTAAYHVLKHNHKKNNSKVANSTNWENTNSQTTTETGFKKKKQQWGAGSGKTPEEDWGRFTKDFEESNPNFWKKYEEEFWKKYESRINNDAGFGKKKEKTKKSDPEINFSVEVDPTLCIGCCSCETIAPEVFVVDKNTKMNPKSKAYNQRGTGYNKVLNAAETCPTKAINVDDVDLKKRIYPW